MLEIDDVFYCVKFGIEREGVRLLKDIGSSDMPIDYLIPIDSTVIGILECDWGQFFADDSHVTYINQYVMYGASESCALYQAMRLWRLMYHV